MLRFLTAGESHGQGLVCIIDGLPAGLSVDIDQVNFELARRQKGYGRGGRMKIERDKVIVQAGVRHGKTIGSPVSFIIPNKDWGNWSDIMDPAIPPPSDLPAHKARLAFDNTRPRPGHADLGGALKYHHEDLRNVLERASARETAARVACGALAKQFLSHFGVEFASQVICIGTVEAPATTLSLAEIREKSEASEVRCVDGDTEVKMIAAIREAITSRDSLGGIYEVIVEGLPIGLGSYRQWDTRLDARLAAAFMSIPSVKGVEIGAGFAGARRLGSVAHDEIFYGASGDPRKARYSRVSNHAGGLEGGITNGEPVVVRAANKPISTLYRPLRTVDMRTKEPAEAIVERTDNCVTPAHCVIGEAMAALVLAEAFLDKFGSDNMDDIDAGFQHFLAAF